MDTVKLIFKRQSRLYSFILLIISIAFGITSSVFAAEEKTNSNNSAQAQMAQQFGATNLGTNSLGIKNPGTDLWRDVRNLGSKGSNGKSNTNSSSTSQVKGYETGAFINSQGQEWRNFRMTKLVPYSLYILGVVLLGITLFRLIRGEIKLKAGRSGKKIKRFTSFQRTVHWVVAILFVILGFTGVLLTFGRTLLIPLIGSQAFGPIAGVGKFLHDYLGPVFAIALVVMIFTFFKGNFFKSIDLKWFLKGGGLIGKHVSAGRYNAGEKAWYWFAMIVGVVVVISGLILDFPYFVHTRTNLELSHIFMQ